MPLDASGHCGDCVQAHTTQRVRAVMTPATDEHACIELKITSSKRHVHANMHMVLIHSIRRHYLCSFDCMAGTLTACLQSARPRAHRWRCYSSVGNLDAICITLKDQAFVSGAPCSNDSSFAGLCAQSTTFIYDEHCSAHIPRSQIMLPMRARAFISCASQHVACCLTDRLD
jgi:hypothetical protein